MLGTAALAPLVFLENGRSRRGGPDLGAQRACLAGGCAPCSRTPRSPVQSLPSAPLLLPTPLPAACPPASGCEISQWRSPCQLASHVGDVSIFIAASNIFQTPQPQPERSGPRGAAATSHALEGAAALPAMALIAATQRASCSPGRCGVTDTGGQEPRGRAPGAGWAAGARWRPQLKAAPRPETRQCWGQGGSAGQV